MKRRKFMKMMVGFMGGLCLPKSAYSFWFSQLTGLGNSWANWDEGTEAGWGDQNNVFICFFENPVANGDETGQGGGLSGADLVLTEAGSVAGATGTPPTRIFDGSDNRFQFTQNVFDNIAVGADEWTIILKLKDLANHHDANDDYIISINATWNVLRDSAAEAIQFGTLGTTSASPGTSGDIWIIMAKPPGENTYGAFAEGTKPKLKANIPSANIADFGSAVDPPTSTERYIGAFSDGSQAMASEGYYFLVAKKYLL